MARREDEPPLIEDPLLGTAQVAEVLNASKETVRRLVNRGRLPRVPFMRNIRVRRSDLERFIKQNTIGGR